MLDLPSRREYCSDQCKRWWRLKILYNNTTQLSKSEHVTVCMQQKNDMWKCSCFKPNDTQYTGWPLAHPQLPSNTTTQRVPLSRLAGSDRRSAGSQMPSLAFAFTVLVATIALLFGHWTSANLHHTNNTTERTALVPLAHWRSEMHLLLFMRLSHSSSRTQSLSSHRRTRKLTFNNIRVKHPSVSAPLASHWQTHLLKSSWHSCYTPIPPGHLTLLWAIRANPNPAQPRLVLNRGPS